MAKTEITAKQLYENRNTSDVFSRLVIMGVLRVLNQKLRYTQVWEDTEDGTQEITVPFFFDFSGGAGTSEKFIQDNYMNWTDDECTSMGIKKVNGDYKPIPYGVISLESTNIESGNISNRFVMGQFQKRINGELKPYVACLYSIPLTMSFTVNIACDTVNTMWKIEQAYREFFYKNKTFHINYKGTVVPCRIGFPESLTENKTANYTMGAQQKDGADVKLSFGLNCETYQPVFDPYTEMPADRNIKGFKGGITLQEKSSLTTDKYGETQIIKERVIDENGYIEAEHIDRLNVVALEDILLKWNFFYNYSDLLHVDILYVANYVVPQLATQDVNTALIAILVQSIYGVTMFVAPTSIAVILGLSYLNIPYKEWIKKTWKLVLTLFAIVVVVLIAAMIIL